MLIAIAALGLIMWFYFKSWIGRVGIVCAILAAGAIYKRKNHREGYIDGYDDGFQAGVNKALGISDEIAGQIGQMAIDMEIDDRTVEAFDKQKPAP